MHAALHHHRVFSRVRRVLMLTVAPLLLVCLIALPGGALPASAAGSGGVDISAGGPAAAPFVADEDFTGGATAATTNAITTTGVTNPAPQSVYQHNRYGNFTYTVPGLTAGASYNVRLDFAEEYWTTAGSRTFNVLINGAQVLTSFDIFATAGGEFKAVAESFTATASSAGAVTIQFVTVKDNAQVNGIEISPVGGTANTVTVTSPGNQATTVGTAASVQVHASDSASGQTLTYSASGLPAGLSINSATGLITGTPTTAATSTVTVTATDTTGATGTASFTWTVNPSAGTGGVDISAGGPAAAPFVADEDFTGGTATATTNAITTTGVTNPAPQSVYQHNRYGNFTYTVPGLTAGASYNVRLDFAEEYWTTAGSRTFNVLINGDQVLTSFDIFATAGGEFKAVAESFTATASSAGAVTIQFVTVKDNAQVNGIEISPSGSTANTVTVTSPGNQTTNAGTAASLQVHASDSASGQTLTYSATGLPAGLSINSGTGVISGTPTTAGTSTVTVTATDTTGVKGSATFTWTVNAATGNTVTVTNPGSQSGTVGTAASLQVSASDSASGQTLTYTATGLPAGLSIAAATGLITGTPTTAATSTVTVTATDTTGATASASFTWAINASGSGEPPASFWGNTSAIPAATNVVEVSIVNQTNGQYPDSEVYWSFNGQTESIAQQPYIDMPANSAGRMYFYLGSPTSSYYDFIEFTVGASSINVDTTRVDRFGLKLALLLHGHDGSNQEVGENYATFQESRAATFQRFENFVPTEFKELATDDAPYGIPSPGNDPAFQAGGAYANYYTSYAAANGDTTDSTAQIFGCGGTLANNPTLCAGLNRHVAQLPAAQQSNPANFYQAAPANYYAEFWHENAINGVQYGFPYDDDAGQSSDISVTNPQYMVVAVGW